MSFLDEVLFFRKAIDLNMNDTVAIKRLRNPFSNVEYAKETYREFAVLQLANHRNVRDEPRLS